jgi:uncharacterized protein
MSETISVGDPTTEPFWNGCREGRLVVQRCAACGHHQFYPRPFCLACEQRRMAWVKVGGKGTIYSITTIRVPVTPELPPLPVFAVVG